MEHLRGNQTKILEMNNKISKKRIFHWMSFSAKEKVNKLKDTAVDFIQTIISNANQKTLEHF